MQEVELANEELVVLADFLARLRNGELDAAFEEDLPLRKDIWQINQEREELWARFNHLNSVLEWWNAQTSYVFAHVKGPQHSGFRAPSSNGPPQATATADNWQSPRTLLGRLYYQPLERALRLWVDDLRQRGMLSEEDAAQIQFKPPIDEHRQRKQAETQKRLAEFQANFEAVLQRVEQVAEKRGRHPGLPRRQALNLWNSRFSERYKDRRLLAEFIRALEKERLLPPFSATAKTATDAVKALLGV